MGLTAVTVSPPVVVTLHEYVTVPVWPVAVQVELVDEAMPVVFLLPKTDSGLTVALKLFLMAPAS